MDIFGDEYFMKKAIELAQIAEENGEVPVGTIVVCENRIIAKAYNLTEKLNDVTAHAEMQAITSASEFLGGKYLNNCTLYVTLEPCVMCAGALAWSQIGKVVFGAYDEKRGYSKFTPNILHPKTEIIGGILENECSMMVKEFFKSKRNK